MKKASTITFKARGKSRNGIRSTLCGALKTMRVGDALEVPVDVGKSDASTIASIGGMVLGQKFSVLRDTQNKRWLIRKA